MSVLPCDRSGCEGIMCDRYNGNHGYLCNSCFEQLCRLPIGTDVYEFMENHREAMPELNDYYDEMFPLT